MGTEEIRTGRPRVIAHPGLPQARGRRKGVGGWHFPERVRVSWRLALVLEPGGEAWEVGFDGSGCRDACMSTWCCHGNRRRRARFSPATPSWAAPVTMTSSWPALIPAKTIGMTTSAPMASFPWTLMVRRTMPSALSTLGSRVGNRSQAGDWLSFRPTKGEECAGPPRR